MLERNLGVAHVENKCVLIDQSQTRHLVSLQTGTAFVLQRQKCRLRKQSGVNERNKKLGT